MSVTFHPSLDSKVQHVLRCGCGEWTSEQVYPDRDSAYEARPSLSTGCSDEYCISDNYLFVTPVVAEPEVQMSNGNAADLLDALGIQVEDEFADRCCGSMDAEMFLGRVMLAKAFSHFEVARPAYQEGNLYVAPRPAGYVSARLEGLQTVAEWAIANYRTVSWG